MSANGPPTPNAGTPDYAAPEMRNPKTMYNGKVDIFAFGLVLYEIIGDVPVYRGGCPNEMPQIPVFFGELMKGLIPRCWSVNPNDRPSFEAIFNEFRSCDFAILPGVDKEAISRAVSAVLAEEQKRR
jgi:serine/threonine protein kinase